MFARYPFKNKYARSFLYFMVFIQATVISTTMAEDGQSGLTATKLKLPSGPGSIGGVGENASVNFNMGSVNYPVKIALPEGYAGLTPALSLSYSSGNGNSLVGMGWSFPKMRVERMTSKGLPTYDAEDLFAAGGGAELVRVDNEENVYRARMEGGFVRYTWLRLAGEDGEEHERHGYWKAEFPDGRVAYFGATAEGVKIPEARMEGAREGGREGTFAYYVVEMVDVLGHRVVYEYTKDAGHPYISNIAWAFTENGPRYEAELRYEHREDWLTDGKSGVEVVLSKRLTSITVLVRGQQLRAYALHYETYDDSGGLSRLASVHQYGMDEEEAYPVVFSFDYTTPSLPDCDAEGVCPELSLTDLGNLGVDFRGGNADLIDINGDGLPDVIDSRDGIHMLYTQGLRDDGTLGFLEGVQSDVAERGAMQLSSAQVHMLDLDGNGHSDMVSAGALNQVLWNRGQGDWSEIEELFDAHIPDLSQDANLKFFDVDHDKSIDAMHIGRDGMWYFKNNGHGVFEEDAILIAEGVGLSFQDDHIQLADMNGDGMSDVVRMLPGSDRLVYRAHLGYGRFAEGREMEGLPPNLDPAFTDLVDINGDGLSDVVVVQGDEIRFCINRDGHVFSTVRQISALQDNASLPARGGDISIRFADMNGSGTKDVVWIDGNGHIQYLELFEEKPNLLKETRNEIGKVIQFSYGTSTSHMARDGGPAAWHYRLPFPIQTLEHVETYSTLSPEVKHIQQMHYRHGYYDGEEKQFHGFEEVEMFAFGDDSIEPGRTSYIFDVGREDLYRKGLTLRTELYSDERALSETRNTYEDCEISPISEEEPRALTPAVRWVCLAQTDTILKEGQPEQEWVTLRKRMHYDGYGNTTWVHNDGVVARGVDAGGCAPCEQDNDEGEQGGACGPECLGDEQIEEAAFIPPENNQNEQGAPRWMIRVPYLKRNHGATEQDALFTEERFYYDGEGDQTLQLGRVNQGLLRTTETKTEVDENTYVSSGRIDYDNHGNPTQSIDVLGRKMTFGYDEDGLLLTSETFVFDNEARDAPYEMQQTVGYHPILEVATESRSWQKKVGGQVLSGGHASEYSYDSFGRLASIAHPGDTLEHPTQVFEYTLASPMSHILTRARSARGGDFDMESMQCFDGMGQKYQSVTKTEEGHYLTDGWILYNAQGKPRATYQPYAKAEFACDQSAPEQDFARVTTVTMDATARALRTTLPDADMYGTASFSEVRHLPLVTHAFDSEDTDPESPFFDTPLSTFTDGLGRTVRVERLLEQDGAPIVTKMRYDGLGRISKLIDNAANTKHQHYDLRGRIIRVQDPNSGAMTMQYDDAGQLISTIDALGQTLRSAYDEAGRMTTQYQVDEQGRPMEDTRVQWHYDDSPLCSTEVCTNTEGKLVAVRYPLLTGEAVVNNGPGADAQNRDAWGIDTSSYDERDQVTRFTRSRLGRDFVFTTAYDNVGRATQVTYPTGQIIEPEYDAAGRVRSIPGYLTEVSFYEQGIVEHVTYQNGIDQHFTYDGLLRNTENLTTNQAGTVLQGHRFEFSRTSQIDAILDQRAEHVQPQHGQPGHPEKPSATAFFEYDALQRLTAAHLDPGHEKEESMHYRYNLIGNILEKRSTLQVQSPAHVGQMQYGQNGAGPHALTRAGNAQLRYDGKGQLIEKRLFGQNGLEDGSEDGIAITEQYRWDHLGRLRQVRKTTEDNVEAENEEEPVENIQASFYYNGSGERTLKLERSESGNFSRTDYLAPDFELRDGVATLYIRHNNGRIAKTESTRLMAALLSDVAPLSVEENQAVAPQPNEEINAADAWVAYAHEQEFQLLDEAPGTSAETLLMASAKRLIAAPNDAEQAEGGGQPGAFEQRQQTTFFHNNHLMSTTLSTDHEGNILQENLHYPYGQVRYQSAHMPDYSFTDKERDKTTGFTYHSARYYNPLYARWISTDPLFATLGEQTFERIREASNVYEYGLCSPINAIDAKGTFVCVGVCIAIFGFAAVKGISLIVAAGGTGLAASMAGETMTPRRRRQMYRDTRQALGKVATIQAEQVLFNTAGGVVGHALEGARIIANSSRVPREIITKLVPEISQRVASTAKTVSDHQSSRESSIFVGSVQEEFVGPVQTTSTGRRRHSSSRRQTPEPSQSVEIEYAHPDEYTKNYSEDDGYLEANEALFLDDVTQCGVNVNCF